MGIPEKNRFIRIGCTKEELAKDYKKLLKISRNLTKDKREHTILVYAGGHGATDNENQLFLLNSNNPDKAVF